MVFENIDASGAHISWHNYSGVMVAMHCFPTHFLPFLLLLLFSSHAVAFMSFRFHCTVTRLMICHGIRVLQWFFLCPP